MVLKSFGCSFTWGTELSDCPATTTAKSYSQKTWPALAAAHLRIEYQCYARGGAGNLYIVDQVLNQAATQTTPALYIINWTWIDRFDYCDPSDNQWHSILPNSDSSEYYYKNLHSQYRDKLTTLSQIKLVIDTLTQKNIQFVMTNLDELIFETDWHTSPGIQDMQNYILPHITTFNGGNFLNWCKENNFEISKLWHPLDDAHLAAFEYFKNNQTFSKYAQYS